MNSSKNLSIFLLISFTICLSNFSSIACAKAKIKKSTVNTSKNTKTETRNKAKTEDVQDDLLKILKDDYPTFVKNLGDNIKDPKFRAAIKSLSTANKVNSTIITVPVVYSIPTQNEIDVEKSLKLALTSVASARDFLFCTGPVRIANKTIVTSAGGKYVIDGHHRWSQVYSINSKCSMAALDLTDIKDPINALKGTQLGIAAGQDKNGNDITSIPVAIVEGKNLLKFSQADLSAYVLQTITADVLKVFKEFNAAIDTNQKVADYIWTNIALMQKNNQPISGAPGRSVMPQTDLAVNWSSVAVNTDKVLKVSLTASGYVFTNFFAMIALFFVVFF